MINIRNNLEEIPAPSASRRRTGFRRSSCLGPSSAQPTTSSLPCDSDEYGFSSGNGYDCSSIATDTNNINRCDINLEYAMHPPIPPSPPILEPISPERKARKQRSRPTYRSARRGGACHSDLLKSAVLATMESYVSSEDEDTLNIGGKIRSHSVRSSSSISCAGGETLLLPSAANNNGNGLMMDDSSRNSRSSRKRARQHGNEATVASATEDGVSEMATSSGSTNGNTTGGVILVDECLLAGAMEMCSISSHSGFSGGASSSSSTTSTRHVARRTSQELAYGLVPSPRTNGSGVLSNARTTWPPPNVNQMARWGYLRSSRPFPHSEKMWGAFR